MNKYIKFLIIALILAVAIPQVALAAWWNPFSWGVWNRVFHFQQTEQKQDQTVCTMDAKLCPDGSYVGREGPKCEFKPCPGENVGKCETDKDCPTIYCIKAPCPQNKCINHTCQAGFLLDVVYPFYEGVNWGVVTPKTMDALNEGKLSGYEVAGSAQIAKNGDAYNFFTYYDKKLKALGWVEDINFGADGITGGQCGYKKDDARIALNLKITPGKVTSKKDEPMQWTCPCKVDYTIFIGYVSGAQNPPVVGGDRDAHGCIGSAGYSWCEAKKKCLRAWEEKCEATSTPTQNSNCIEDGKTGTRRQDDKNNCCVGLTEIGLSQTNGVPASILYKCVKNSPNVNNIK